MTSIQKKVTLFKRGGQKIDKETIIQGEKIMSDLGYGIHRTVVIPGKTETKFEDLGPGPKGSSYRLIRITIKSDPELKAHLQGLRDWEKSGKFTCGRF